MSEKKIDHGFFFSVSKITFHVSHRSFIIRWLSFYQPYKKVAVKEIEQYYYFNGDLHRNLRAGCVIGCPEITIIYNDFCWKLESVLRSQYMLFYNISLY